MRTPASLTSIVDTMLKSCAKLPAVESWRPPLWYDRLSAVSWRFLAIVFAIATIVTLVFSLSAVMLPAFLALLMASVLKPVSARLRRAGLRPGLAAGLVVLVLVAFILGVVWLTVHVVVDQWASISAGLAHAVDTLEHSATDNLGVDNATARSIGSDISGAVANVSDVLITGLTRLVPVAVAVLTTLVLSIVVTFFYVRDGDTMWAWALRSLDSGPSGTIDRVGRKSFRAIAAYMRAQTVIATIDAGSIALGAWILGVPAPGAIFMLTFAMAYIPYIGALIAGAFAVLLAVSDSGVGLGAWMLLIVLAVQFIESYILLPVVQSRGMKIHPLVVLLAMVAGGSIGGLLGMLTAVPLVGAGIAAMGELRRDGILGPGPSIHVQADPSPMSTQASEPTSSE